MRGLFAMTTGLFVLAGCADSGDQASTVINQFDHVMVGVADLEAGIAELEETTGLTPVYGGTHPGRDTQNALLSLGRDRYFELIAPQDGLTEITDSIALEALEFDTPVPMHWAIATNDIEATHAIVAQAGWSTTTISARSRETPDGGVLNWRMFFITDDPEAASIPFFIEWDASAAHPSSTSPGGCELAQFNIVTPDQERILMLLEALSVDVMVDSGDADALAVTLNCGGTEVEFSAAQ